MKTLLKKIILVISSTFLVLTSVLALPAAAHAQTWYNQNPIEWYLKVYDPSVSPPNEIFGERYTAAQVQWIFWSIPSFFVNAMLFGHTEIMVCILSPDLDACLQAAAINIVDIFQSIKDSANNLLGYNSGIDTVANLVVRNQISGIAYTKNLLSKFNPVTKVDAQGFGYTTGANSIQKLWKISRDLSYMLLVIAVIVLAFMIMFRRKINPQTVITIQSALPKIIVAVILITFSYAIAGFLIDLMYVVIAIIAAFIQSQGLTDAATPAALFKDFTTGENAIGLLFEFWFAFMLTSLASIFSGGVMTWIGGIFLTIFAILTIFPILLWFVKIIILLIKTFVNIVLGIVLGPLQILLGTVVPGAGFGPWLRNIVSHLAVYPVMALFFFLAFFFLAQSINQTLFRGRSVSGFATIFPFNPKVDVIQGNTWAPPLTTGATKGEALLWALVAFVIIGMIPKTMEIIKAAIQGKPFDYGSGLGEATGALKGAWGMTGAPVTRAFQEVGSKASIARMAEGVDTRLAPTRAPQWLKDIVARMHS